jgi:hypothetical protein
MLSGDRVSGDLASGDLSTDLIVGVLTPASSVRGVEGHTPRQDTPGKARRRSRPEEDDSYEDNPASDASVKPEHQIDDLA